ncbi:MAG: RNA-binding protein [Sphingomonadales bacterium]|jgi:RNA recognition motif-containing protein|nr:RNA-binding protein [Sphingomonadales bacterium]
MKIFVAGLPLDMDDAELEEFFEKFGKVDSVKVALDRQTGKSRGFAFVEMPVSSEAREAIATLNNLGIGRKVLVVKEATDSPESRHPSSPTRPSSSSQRPFRPGSGRPPQRY